MYKTINLDDIRDDEMTVAEKFQFSDPDEISELRQINGSRITVTEEVLAIYER